MSIARGSISTRRVSIPVKREDWGESLHFLRAPSPGVRRTWERLVRRLKVPKALKFVTIPFPMPWLFAIIISVIRFLVSYREFYLPEFEIKNVSSLSSKWLI